MYTIFNQLKEKNIFTIKKYYQVIFTFFPKIYLFLFQQNRYQTFTHYQISHSI